MGSRSSWVVVAFFFSVFRKRDALLTGAEGGRCTHDREGCNNNTVKQGGQAGSEGDKKTYHSLGTKLGQGIFFPLTRFVKKPSGAKSNIEDFHRVGGNWLGAAKGGGGGGAAPSLAFLLYYSYSKMRGDMSVQTYYTSRLFFSYCQRLLACLRLSLSSRPPSPSLWWAPQDHMNTWAKFSGAADT